VAVIAAVGKKLPDRLGAFSRVDSAPLEFRRIIRLQVAVYRDFASP
jgi:hypothetical protein